MYETRWPRPGPALLVVGVVFGLIVGGILGISFPISGSDQPEATTTTLTAPQTTAPLLASFYTVVLASPFSSQEAQAKVARLQARGVTGARILARTEYPSLGSPYAICVGTFRTDDQAKQTAGELKAQHPDLTPYIKPMRRAA